MSVQNFISELQRTGFALSKPFLFEVTMLDPAMGQNGQMLKMMCHEATLPAWNIQAVPHRIYGYTVEMPADYQLGPVNFSFYVDRSLSIMKLFEDAKKRMFNPVNYSLKFRNEYSFQTEIAIFDIDNMSRVATYKLESSFIKNVRAGNLSWAALDQIQNVQVELAYDHYTVDFHTLSSHPNKPSPTSILDNILDSKYFRGTAIDKVRDTVDMAKGMFNRIPPINFDTVQRLMPDALSGFKSSADDSYTPPDP